MGLYQIFLFIFKRFLSFLGNLPLNLELFLDEKVPVQRRWMRMKGARGNFLFVLWSLRYFFLLHLGSGMNTEGNSVEFSLAVTEAQRRKIVSVKENKSYGKRL